jgi:hypothetical protein
MKPERKQILMSYKAFRLISLPWMIMSEKRKFVLLLEEKKSDFVSKLTNKNFY